MNTTSITYATILFYVGVLIGCTEITQTTGASTVDVGTDGTSTVPTGADSPSVAGQPTLSFDPPSVTTTVGKSEFVTVNLNDGTLMGISPSSITIGGLDPAVAVFAAVDERTIEFIGVGVGNTVPIISVTGPGVTHVLQRGYSVTVE